MGQVTRVSTPITANELADALATAWPSVVGTDPVDVAILILVAQSAFETGGWASLWNYNLGNVKHVGGDGYDYFTMTASEGESGTMVSSEWRAYPDLSSGAAGFLKVIVQGYGSAFSQALSGNPRSFVAALKRGGYFTGNLAQYQAGVVSWFKKLGGIVPSALPAKGALVIGGAAIGLVSYFAWRRAGSPMFYR